MSIEPWPSGFDGNFEIVYNAHNVRWENVRKKRICLSMEERKDPNRHFLSRLETIRVGQGWVERTTRTSTHRRTP